MAASELTATSSRASAPRVRANPRTVIVNVEGEGARRPVAAEGRRDEHQSAKPTRSASQGSDVSASSRRALLGCAATCLHHRPGHARPEPATAVAGRGPRPQVPPIARVRAWGRPVRNAMIVPCRMPTSRRPTGATHDEFRTSGCARCGISRRRPWPASSCATPTRTRAAATRRTSSTCATSGHGWRRPLLVAVDRAGTVLGSVTYVRPGTQYALVSHEARASCGCSASWSTGTSGSSRSC